MGLLDGLFGNGLGGILGGFGEGQVNMNDQQRAAMHQAQFNQQNYYDQLRNYSTNQLQQELEKARRKKIEINEDDIIDAEFEVITEIKALPEPK